MQQRAGRRLEAALADRAPGLAQVGDVVGQLGIGRLFGVGAQDEAASAAVFARAHQRRHARAQLLAQLGRSNLLRDADVLVLRQEHEQPPRDADLRRQPRALGADRVLDHLHRQRLTFKHEALDRRRRHRARAMVPTRGAAVHMHVGHMQERGALEADVDERRLHAGQHAGDASGVDVADQPALQRAFDMELLHRAVLDHGDARFLRSPVDEDVLHGRGVLCRAQKRTRACLSSCAVSYRGKPMIPE